MASYLISVNYKVLGVSHTVLLGVENGIFPNQEAVMAAAKTTVANYRAGHGETITNVVALVSLTR